MITEMTNEDMFNMINVYDFIYTKSEKGEDVGFVIKKSKNAFVVTFSQRCKKVTFYLNKDKKFRLIKEIWQPSSNNTFRRVYKKDE